MVLLQVYNWLPHVCDATEKITSDNFKCYTLLAHSKRKKKCQISELDDAIIISFLFFYRSLDSKITCAKKY